MKSIFIAGLLLTAVSSVQANTVRLVSADATPLSQLCIAAVESRSALLEVAYEQKIPVAELNTISCNAMPLPEFVRSYRLIENNEIQGFVFSSNDESALTRLCIAAVKSPDEFLKLKAELSRDFKNIEAEVLCNNMPLNKFTQKYRTVALTASR